MVQLPTNTHTLPDQLNVLLAEPCLLQNLLAGTARWTWIIGLYVATHTGPMALVRADLRQNTGRGESLRTPLRYRRSRDENHSRNLDRTFSDR